MFSGSAPSGSSQDLFAASRFPFPLQLDYNAPPSFTFFWGVLNLLFWRFYESAIPRASLCGPNHGPPKFLSQPLPESHRLINLYLFGVSPVLDRLFVVFSFSAYFGGIGVVPLLSPPTWRFLCYLFFLVLSSVLISSRLVFFRKCWYTPSHQSSPYPYVYTVSFLISCGLLLLQKTVPSFLHSFFLSSPFLCFMSAPFLRSRGLVWDHDPIRSLYSFLLSSFAPFSFPRTFLSSAWPVRF